MAHRHHKNKAKSKEKAKVQLQEPSKQIKEDSEEEATGKDVSRRYSARGITLKDLEDRSMTQRKAERNLIKVVKAYRNIPTMRMTMGQRRFLFFWHLAVILASVGMVGIGTFLTYWFDEYLAERVKSIVTHINYQHFVVTKEKPKLFYVYGPIITEHGNALIGLGLTYLFVTFFYISFLGHRFQFTWPVLVLINIVPLFTWPVLVLINIVALVLELSNLLVRLSPVAQLSNTQRIKFEQALKEYKVRSSDEFSVAYDFLSIWGKCCGVNSAYDFQGTIYTYEEVVDGQRNTYTLQIGCFSVIFDLIQSYQVVYVFIIGFYILDLVIHVSIYRDMLVRLEPQLGIETLKKLEELRVQQWKDFQRFEGDTGVNFLVSNRPVNPS